MYNLQVLERDLVTGRASLHTSWNVLFLLLFLCGSSNHVAFNELVQSVKISLVKKNGYLSPGNSFARHTIGLC